MLRNEIHILTNRAIPAGFSVVIVGKYDADCQMVFPIEAGGAKWRLIAFLVVEVRGEVHFFFERNLLPQFGVFFP